MMWVLVVLLIDTSFTVDYQTKETCEKAAQVIKQNAPVTAVIRAFCIPRD